MKNAKRNRRPPEKPSEHGMCLRPRPTPKESRLKKKKNKKKRFFRLPAIVRPWISARYGEDEANRNSEIRREWRRALKSKYRRRRTTGDEKQYFEAFMDQVRGSRGYPVRGFIPLMRDPVVKEYAEEMTESMGYFSPRLMAYAEEMNKLMMGFFSLRLSSGACSWPKTCAEDDIPSYDEEGEDAYFICHEEQTIGVSDGVGGYADRGIDSGVYARQLMSHASEFVRHRYSTGSSVDPMEALNHAFVNTTAEGASTACIVTVKDNTLRAVNIGDSGFMVCRDGEIVCRSPIQQSYFNCPFQLGGSSVHTPRDADEIAFAVQSGDLVVVATDGVFDNLFDSKVEHIVWSCWVGSYSPEVAAFNVAKIARKMSLEEDEVTPFTLAAVKAGRSRKKYLGGKYDDVTVIVGYIY